MTSSLASLLHVRVQRVDQSCCLTWVSNRMTQTSFPSPSHLAELWMRGAIRNHCLQMARLEDPRLSFLAVAHTVSVAASSSIGAVSPASKHCEVLGTRPL